MTNHSTSPLFFIVATEIKTGRVVFARDGGPVGYTFHPTTKRFSMVPTKGTGRPSNQRVAATRFSGEDAISILEKIDSSLRDTANRWINDWRIIPAHD